jgi:farnesyltranstransferase
MMVGAALAGASEEEIKVIEDSARDIGLAFQIRDDILDVTSTTDELGKPVFSDEKNDKTTYVTIEGIEKAKSDVEEISKRAVSALQSLGRKNDFLEELVLMLVNRKK